MTSGDLAAIRARAERRPLTGPWDTTRGSIAQVLAHAQADVRALLALLDSREHMQKMEAPASGASGTAAFSNADANIALDFYTGAFCGLCGKRYAGELPDCAHNEREMIPGHGLPWALARALDRDDELYADLAEAERLVGVYREALAKAADTFGEFAGALTILRHPTLAEAAQIAEDGTRAALVVSETGAPPRQTTDGGRGYPASSGTEQAGEPS